MLNQNKKLFLQSCFAFSPITIFGILVGTFSYLMSSETKPISGFLFSPYVYIITTLIAISARMILWICIDKGTMFELGRIFFKTVQDIIIINLVTLSTISLFFLSKFFL